MRPNQTNFVPWGTPITANGFIKEIKPSDAFASVIIMNVGDVPLYLWTYYKIEAGGSFSLQADQTAFLSLSKVPVSFATGTSGINPKLVVLAEKVSRNTSI